jgi:uncharacterized protein (TIGR02466 family)
MLLEMESQRESFVARAYEIKETHNRASHWRCDTYNTLNSTYDFKVDHIFTDLIQVCKSHVGNFSRSFGINNPVVSVSDAWINIANPGNYQEYHLHPTNHFSLVYYVQTQSDCGDIVFRSPEANTDMYPLEVDVNNGFNYKTCSYRPENNRMIIFRSNLLHMVEKNMSNADRISISMNFNVRK